MNNGEGSLDLEQLFKEMASKRPKVEYSEGETRSIDLIHQWREADFDLESDPETKEALVRAIDEEFEKFESANTEPITDDRSYLLKALKLYEFYPRELGMSSTFDYELGYKFMLEGLTGICNDPTSGRRYMLDFLYKTRPYYNNPDLANDEKKSEVVKHFPEDSDFDTDIEDMLVDLEVFFHIEPGNYYCYAINKTDLSQEWDEEKFQEWKATLPIEYTKGEGGDIIRNNLHWVENLLFDLYKNKKKIEDVQELYESVSERAKARLDKFYSEK